MGSAGALLWHTPQQLHGRGVLFRQSRPLLRQRNLPLISLAAPAPEPERRRRQCLRCAAVDGDGALRESGPLPQKESPSSGIGAALEDPPPGPPGTPDILALLWCCDGAPRQYSHMLNMSSH
jgi:sec-independent protein translocase protein TatC